MPKGVYKRKPRLEEHSKRISESNMGRLAWNKDKKCPQISKALKGRKSPWVAKENRKRKGIKKSIEIRKKMSKAKLKEKNPMFGMKREKNPNWKDGATSKNRIARESWDYDNWRKEVFMRDNWTCQSCEAKGGKLHPHHIYNFADNIDLRFVIENGIALCKNCHEKFHKIYGKKNNNALQLIEFLKSAHNQSLLKKIEEIKKRYKCAACDGAKCEHTLGCQALEDIKKLLK